MGVHMVFAYSKMGQVIARNVNTISFFGLTHLLEVRALRMLSICFDGNVYML